MPRTARAIRAPNRLSWREEIPHPPRDFLSPPPHRRKKVQILGPDRSRANRTGHLDVLTIPLQFFLDKRRRLKYSLLWVNLRPSGRQLPLFSCPSPFCA